MKIITNTVVIVLFAMACFYTKSLQAQGSIIAGPDTVICSGSVIALHADVEGGFGTENYVFETIPYTPEPYEGTGVPLSDDDYDGPFNIGFSFCFMGETYDQFWVGSNGWISFGGAGALTATYISTTIPSVDPDVPKNCIMSPWEDWDPGYYPGIYIKYETTGVAPDRKLVISWDSVPMFDCWDSEYGKFQIVIHETTSIIDNHLTHKPNCLSWYPTGTEGVHSLDGTIAYWAPGRNGTTWVADSESVRFVPSGITWFEGDTEIGYSDTISVSPSVTTTYTAQVTLCDGTTYSDDVTVIVGDDFDVSLDLTGVTCHGDVDGAASVSVTGTDSPLIYAWSTGDGNVTDIGPLAGGGYTVTITDTVGCFKTVPFTIEEPEELVASATATNAICFDDQNGSAIINVIGGTIPYQYTLDGGSATFLNTFENLPAGSYSVSITDGHGCVTTTSFDITQPDQLFVNAGLNDTILFGASTSLLATTDAENVVGVNWAPEGGIIPCPVNPCYEYDITPTNTTTYTITITDAAGCKATDSVTIYVQFIPEVFFPTAFSPNGDGANDYFQCIGYNIASYDMKIYNRWGQVVYETTSQDYEDGWDGTFNGTEQEMGAYVWQVNVKFLTGDSFVNTGGFTLVR